MGRLKAVAPLAALGGVAILLAHAPIRPVALLASLVVVVLLPALAASRAVGAVDLLEQLAFAYGGVALSCWSLWVAGVAVGLSQASSLWAPLLASLALASVRPGVHAASPGSLPTGVLPVERRAVLGASAILAGLVVVPFLPYGVTLADGVHRMGMTDWYKHLAVATSLVEASRLPPANPFLGADVEAPYYYGFQLVAAAVLRGAGGVGSPYAALLGLTLATAAALPIVLFVLARGLFGKASIAAVAAVGGSLLAGFDFIVWLLAAIREAVAHWPLGHGFAAVRAVVPSTHLNFWLHHNERQLNPPYLATIWAPHHVSAVLVALLLVHLARGREDGGARSVARACLSAVMLAALPALSAYVALAFGVAVGAVIACEALRERRLPWSTDVCRRWASIGVPAALLSAPVVVTLAGSEGGQLTFAVSAAGSWLNGAVWTSLLGDGTLARVLDTPALYLMQFGVIGACGVLGIRRRAAGPGLTRSQREAATIAAAILLLVTFVRPPVGTPNNLFARPTLVVWAVLACFAADDWCEWGRRRMRRIALAICAAGTLLAVVGAAAEGALFWPTPVDTVRAARWINDHVAAGTVVAAPREQHGLGYWLWRRAVIDDRRLALLFGATPDAYDAEAGRLDDAYGATAPEEAWRRFGALGADAVLVNRPVPAWGRLPCFHAGYDGDRIVVLERARACPSEPVREGR